LSLDKPTAKVTAKLKLKDLINDKNVNKPKNITSAINPVNQIANIGIIQKQIVTNNTSFINTSNLMSKPKNKPTILKN
jgi:hypothetical protein